jgi:plastocyanin
MTAMSGAPVAARVMVLALAVACSGSGSGKASGPTTPTAPAARPAPAPKQLDGPVAETAQLLREAADQLDKAQAALDRKNRSLAEQLFSTAELLVGADTLVSLAPIFREGAPPRISTPTVKVDVTAPPQPKVAGNSEDEDDEAKVPPPRVETSSLSGTLMIDGQGANGTYGLVTLEPASGRWKPRTPKRVVIEQRGREFLPRLVAISVGSTISFPNFDSVFHNVFSTAPQAAFDLGLYKAGEAREYTFTQPGFIRLGCNLHSNMSAHIAVVAAPAYVVTDEKGAFTFRRVVPGKYKLRAWSVRSAAPITQDVTIKPGKNQITIGVTGDAPAGPPPDKFGGKRG